MVATPPKESDVDEGGIDRQTLLEETFFPDLIPAVVDAMDDPKQILADLDKLTETMVDGLPLVEYATMEEFWADYDLGQSGNNPLVRLEGPGSRAGDLFALKVCPFAVETTMKRVRGKVPTVFADALRASGRTYFDYPLSFLCILHQMCVDKVIRTKIRVADHPLKFANLGCADPVENAEGYHAINLNHRKLKLYSLDEKLIRRHLRQCANVKIIFPADDTITIDGM